MARPTWRPIGNHESVIERPACRHDHRRVQFRCPMCPICPMYSLSRRRSSHTTFGEIEVLGADRTLRTWQGLHSFAHETKNQISPISSRQSSRAGPSATLSLCEIKLHPQTSAVMPSWAPRPGWLKLPRNQRPSDAHFPSFEKALKTAAAAPMVRLAGSLRLPHLPNQAPPPRSEAVVAAPCPPPNARPLANG